MMGCTSCNPILYLYNKGSLDPSTGMCTDTCPLPEYIPQNSNYQCVLDSANQYISVSIVKAPYLHKLPRNKQVYLKAYINNTRGSIDQITWTQLSPVYGKVTDTIFTMEYNPITNEIYNSQLQLKMRTTSFTYFSEITSIKVMIEVNNTMGDTTKRLTEIYVNPPPTVGTMTQEIISGQTKPEDGSTDLRIRLTGWYDNVDDYVQRLQYKFYYKYNHRIYVLKNAGNSDMFDVSLPHIAIATNTSTRVPVEL